MQVHLRSTSMPTGRKKTPVKNPNPIDTFSPCTKTKGWTTEQNLNNLPLSLHAGTHRSVPNNPPDGNKRHTRGFGMRFQKVKRTNERPAGSPLGQRNQFGEEMFRRRGFFGGLVGLISGSR
ncbi:hypothetical protein AVEN_81115-1 [Araneus ventricosus]|uniref:Uncharacterized protein n=1 Tax=Araneus ventricosus TaxID=182803 RepID=A0A4Y2DTG3_ARAVE|nr:hypothetical protein AVEN_81115-1 [Araneus ventricosus]